MCTLFRILLYTFAIIGFLLVAAYAALELGWTKTSGIIDSQHEYFKKQLYSGTTTEAWKEGEEWSVLKEAVLKDTQAIHKAALDAGVKPRLIVAILIVEQLRLFHSDRELFKEAFAPLKILAIQSQFSWGVMGIKQDTAKEIEAHLKDSSSSLYLGKEKEHILDFSTNDTGSERFARLTDENDRYFSYLYAGLFLKEIEDQWKNAGFPIDERPDILATLYDLGFEHSQPHVDPLSGGAEIEIGSTTYSFGALAKSFYDSNELIDEFPR